MHAPSYKKSCKNFPTAVTLKSKISDCAGFTIIEIICTISIFLLIIAGILKIQQSFQEREKQIRTRTEMVQIASWLEEYYDLHGDYPRIVAHDDNQGTVLCSALHGKDPNGNTPSVDKKIDLVATSLKEINDKFIDPFLSDYIYYYKLRTDNGTWQNPSYILISKGPKGQQNPQRNLSIAKGVTVSAAGKIDGNPNGDIILTNGGFP
ncbi:MAG: prepilin-type N-terminal cleavage/methylation domain-containing protein [Puniceicoccales bacterium]|jgi:prepilin-type N-terminal cleavage/methylation domain-containing protein|nr:prepilin-type N-terminal cleavage/methylation domain-containing protein [Puniceicoccales bacterium]